MAFATLHAHKFRSFLTVLGVVIGTVTVMVIASFISGLDQKFKQDIESFGTNTVFVYKFDPGIHTGRLTPEERMRKPISYEDAVAIREQCPSVKYVAPFLGPDDVHQGSLSGTGAIRHSGAGHDHRLRANVVGAHRRRTLLHRIREPASRGCLRDRRGHRR